MVNDEETSPELLPDGNMPLDAITMSNLLSYPTNESASSSSSNDTPISVPSTSSSSSRQPLKDRLFIGNLHPSVDEYTLLQIFTKFGKVTKLDFLFHKSGALKGKPRGYAFLEYGSHNEAEKALMSANGKLLLGRKLVVTYAHHAPTDADGVIRPRKTMMETGRPTTLSMLKSSTGWKHKDGTSDKIAIMEAKLRELEASKPKANPEPGTSTLPTSSLPTHPSLPPKPPPAVPAASGSRPTAPKPHSNGPSLSLSRSSSGHSSFPNSEPPTKKLKLGTPTAPDAIKRKSGAKSLLGVKIGKKRSSPSSIPGTPPPASTAISASDPETS